MRKDGVMCMHYIRNHETAPHSGTFLCLPVIISPSNAYSTSTGDSNVSGSIYTYIENENDMSENAGSEISH